MIFLKGLFFASKIKGLVMKVCPIHEEPFVLKKLINRFQYLYLVIIFIIISCSLMQNKIESKHKDDAIAQSKESGELLEKQNTPKNTNDETFTLLSNRCEILFQQKKFEEALKDCKQALKINSKNEKVLFIASSISMELGKNYEAYNDFIIPLIELDNNKSDYLNRACYLLKDLKRYQEAVQTCSYAIQSDERNIAPLKDRAFAYFSLEDYKRSREDLLNIIKILPSDEFSEHFLGRISLAENKDKEAKKHFEKASKMNPKDGSNFYYLGLACHGLSDFNGALQNYKVAEKLGYKNKDLGIKLKSALDKEGLENILEYFLFPEGKNKALFIENINEGKDSYNEKIVYQCSDNRSKSFIMIDRMSLNHYKSEGLPFLENVYKIKRTGDSILRTKEVSTINMPKFINKKFTVVPKVKVRNNLNETILKMPRKGETLKWGKYEAQMQTIQVEDRKVPVIILTEKTPTSVFSYSYVKGYGLFSIEYSSKKIKMKSKVESYSSEDIDSELCK